MPLSSSQIAQLNGAFTQQYMMNQQFAGGIEQPPYNLGGHNTRAQSEGLAASVMNKGSAIGAPIAMAGMGLMGLDPLSMGLRGGMAAYGGGAGLGGAALAGGAVAAPMMAGLAAASYMGNQVMGGMQQTQQFNSNMRSSFAFFNPASVNGRGFSSGDTREIGNNLRGMAGGSIGAAGFGAQGHGGSGLLDQFQLGPSFNELGRLASNMGRMGLADGVRNAKEFNEKFREMMKTVTTIAKEMGTTLEEAQKVMASMKGSGVFAKQGQITSQIRQASISGGLATTEVTGMMNIGSQISRMFGGTGRQGARGGIEAIAQVGTAQQAGVLSEEDIYQATGQTGAEGRRAMAQQQLMQTGSFLKSSKGRWLLASLAGKNGELDAESVNRFESGGMSVNDTRQAAHQNLRGVGRANFIRNEGRLRGAVMEQFGGMAPAMAMMGWAQGKGIDIHSMGDREMLFMQRQLGMGRDEADSLVKMARKLPELMQARRNAKEEDQNVQERQLRERDSGLEGVKRKLEAARDNVNNEMQKVGQDILNAATDRIAAWGNKLAGTYEEHSISGIREAHQAAMMGGSKGRELMQGLTGSGKFIRDLGGAGLTGFGNVHEDVGQKNYREKMQDLQFAARLGTAGKMSDDLAGLVKDQSLEIKRAYADELSGLSGEDRMSGFKRKFGKNTELGKKFRGMDQREQAEFMQQMEGEIGLKSGRLSETFQVPGLTHLTGGGEHFTEADRQEAAGRALLGTGRPARADAPKAGAGGGGVMAGLTRSNDGSGLLGFARSFINEITGSAKQARAAGAMLDDPEMRRVAFDSLSGAAGSEEHLFSAISNIRGKGAEVGGLAKLSKDELGRLGGLEQVRLTSDLMKVANAKGGVDKMSETDWSKLVDRRKKTVAEMGGDPDAVTKESILKDAQGVQDMASAQRKEIVQQIAGQAGKAARQQSQALQAGGIAKLVTIKGQGKGAVEELQLTAEAEARLLKSGGPAAVQAAKMAMGVQGLGMQAGRAGTPQEQAELLEQQRAASGKLYDTMGSMSVKELRALGTSMAGTSVGGQASEMIMRGQAIEGSKRKLGGAGAIAAQLGVQFGADELKGLKGMSPEAAAAALAARMGVGDDKGFVGGLQEAIAAANKKGGGIQGGALLQRALGQADETTKKKLEEAAKGQQSPEEKIIDKIGEGNKYLEALVKSNESARAKLAQIAANTNTPDAEKT